MSIQMDKALSDAKADAYAFYPAAAHVAESIARITSIEGLVVGIEGEWGSGKTSFANFIVSHLQTLSPTPLVVRYNAWVAVDETDAAIGLLSEVQRTLSAAVKAAKANKGQRTSNIDKIKDGLGKVDEVLERFSVGKLSDTAKVGHTLLQTFLGKGSLDQLKSGIRDALELLELRLYVFVDDLDRMAAQHLRVLFATIKTVCDVPGLVFLIALDKQVVANALAQVQGGNGMAYLDKIVSLSVPVPFIERENLVRQLLQHLVVNLQVNPRVFNSKKWAVIEADGIRRFLRKPRDVIRLANAMSMTYPGVRDEVNVVDFLALEALRLFEPEVHGRIKDMPGHLMSDSAEARQHVEKLYALDPPEGSAQRMRTIQQLFPATAPTSWAPEPTAIDPKSVHHAAKFSVYFQFGLIPGALTEQEYARALAALSQGSVALGDYLQRALTLPVRGNHSVVALMLHRLFYELPEKFGVTERFDVLAALSSLSDAQVVLAESATIARIEPTLLGLAAKISRHSVHVWKAHSITELPVVLQNARSIAMVRTILRALEEESREVYEGLQRAVEGVLPALRTLFITLCTKNAANGELWDCLELPGVLNEWLELEGSQVRQSLAGSTLSPDQCLRIAGCFFDATARDSEPFGSLEHAWRALAALGRCFPSDQFDSLLSYSGTAPDWLAGFIKVRSARLHTEENRRNVSAASQKRPLKL